MGSRWLHDLPQALASISGVDYYPGWQTRSRSSGGFDNLYGIVCHHTATSPGASFAVYNRIAWQTHPERPVANISLGRGGEICVGVAGASNHAGKGGPTHMSKGTVPLNSGNRYLIGIEALNTGVGEPWGEDQQNRYIELVRALCAHYGFNPHTDVVSHNLWTPARKIDPAGPSRWGSINRSGTWDFNLFRNEVATASQPSPGEPPPTQPPVEPPSPVNWYDVLMQRMPTLRQGSDNFWYVKRMQHLIAAAGFMNEGNVNNYDGAFGSGTATALKNFQKAAGIPVDAVCGPVTWGALMHTIDGIPTIKNGAKGADVKRMQHLLAANGYMNEGNVSNYDGVWGGGTETAKVNYDNAAGLTPSPPSDCGPKSWTYLLTV
jgi:peptidoglycan hydrolase-like protein with peptidoglycan-binding domain